MDAFKAIVLNQFACRVLSGKATDREMDFMQWYAQQKTHVVTSGHAAEASRAVEHFKRN
ncbi:MAG: hypothetical protein IKL97_05725 [Eggerthellaceae bacterium]|nr:hypothetical protein [Eggerthellaceae bacterium]